MMLATLTETDVAHYYAGFGKGSISFGPFSALASQARRLATLLALRQFGSEQYFWCRAFRGSARKNAPQNRQLCCAGRAMIHPPCGESCGAPARYETQYEQTRKEEKRTTKKTQKSFQIKTVKENRRRKYYTFKPPSSDDFQNAADTQ